MKALPVTVVLAVVWLLEETESKLTEDDAAVMLSVPEVVGVTEIATLAVLAFAIVPKSQ